MKRKVCQCRKHRHLWLNRIGRLSMDHWQPSVTRWYSFHSETVSTASTLQVSFHCWGFRGNAKVFVHRQTGTSVYKFRQTPLHGTLLYVHWMIHTVTYSVTVPHTLIPIPSRSCSSRPQFWGFRKICKCSRTHTDTDTRTFYRLKRLQKNTITL